MKKKDAAHGALDRLRAAYGAPTDTALAIELGVKRSTLGGWRSRGMPYSDCVRLAAEKGWSLDWLLAGRGPMRLDEDRPFGPELSPREEAVLTLFRALTEGEQREIHAAAEEKKRLRELELRMEEVAAAVAGKTSP